MAGRRLAVLPCKKARIIAGVRQSEAVVSGASDSRPGVFDSASVALFAQPLSKDHRKSGQIYYILAEILSRDRCGKLPPLRPPVFLLACGLVRPQATVEFFNVVGIGLCGASVNLGRIQWREN